MVAWNGYNTAMCWQLREDDVSPIFTPLYHAGGMGAFLFPNLHDWRHDRPPRRVRPEEIWRTMERERCTVVLGVPTIYKILMEARRFGPWICRMCAGSLAEARRCRSTSSRRTSSGVAFKQGYGLTEVGVNCFSMTSRSPPEEGLDWQADDVHRGPRRPSGWRGGAGRRGGRVVAARPARVQRLLNNPEATAAALDAEGWFHTGDLARRDEEGFYYIAGRQKTC